MIYSRQYSRQLILLKNSDSSKSGGRCLLEIKNSKGKIVTNTYSLPSGKEYNVCLVLKNPNRKGIILGNLSLGTMEFDPDNIDGNKIEDIGAVAIIPSDGNIPILSGCTGENIDLKGGIFIRSLKAANEETPKKTNFNEEKKSTRTEIKKEKKQFRSDSDKVPDFMEMIGRFRKEMEELERMASNKNSFVQSADKLQKENCDIAEETVVNEEICEKSTLPKNEYIDNISKYHENGEPYIKDNDYAKWYKISPSELAAVPGISSKIMLDPMCSAAYRKYGCILLGICEKDEKYLVGVPYDKKLCDISSFKQVIPSENGVNCYLITV